jgi:hypothetical protein
MRRERIDLYLLHEPDQFVLTDDLLELFESLQRDRAIGAFGLAYGRVADAWPAFGTVVQSRYAEGLKAQSHIGRSRILHGVLRYGWHEGYGKKRDRRPPEYLARVLAAHPEAAVIFSASSPAQIRRVMRNFSS